MPFNSNHDVVRHDRIRAPYPERPQQGITTIEPTPLVYKPRHGETKEYILPGNSNRIPQFNSTEMAIINHAREHPELLGGGVGKFFKRLGRSINKSNRKIEKQFIRAGDDIKHAAIVTGDALEKSATDKKGILRNVISSTLDVGMPLLGEAAATTLGANPVLGKALGNISRKTIKGTTGYGVAGVGVYKGGSKKTIKSQVQAEIDKAIDQYLPETHGKVMGSGAITKDESAAKKKKVNTSRADRNAIVKKVMIERGVSLPAASKIVKAENLYKKEK